MPDFNPDAATVSGTNTIAAKGTPFDIGACVTSELLGPAIDGMLEQLPPVAHKPLLQGVFAAAVSFLFAFLTKEEAAQIVNTVPAALPDLVANAESNKQNTH